MNKIIYGIAVFLMSGSAPGQDLDWGSSVEGIDATYTFMSVSPNGNIILGGECEENSMTEGEPRAYMSDSSVYDLPFSTNAHFVISYSAEGKIRWTYEFDSEKTKLMGLATDKQNNIVLFVNDLGGEYAEPRPPVYRNYTGEEDEEEYYEPESQEQEVLTGYYILFLSPEGKLQGKISCGPGIHIEVLFDFKIHPNGGYVLAGYCPPGPLTDSLPDVKAGTGGGDFILMLDKKGKPLWADVVSYRENSCCSYSVFGCRTSIAPDGTVYLGGAYSNGGTFDRGKIRRLAPRRYEDVTGLTYGTGEAYVVSYSAAGKFNWVRTVLNNSNFGALAASSEGVFFSCVIYGGQNTAFDLPVDTSDHKIMVLSFIGKNGEAAWNRSTVAKSAEGIVLTSTGNAVVYGELDFRIGYFHRRDEQEMPKLGQYDDVYAATFDKNGNYKSLAKAGISITTGNQRMFLALDKADRMYLGGLIWCGQRLDMNWIDKAFKRGQCYGGAAFTGRMKKTN